ncbi:PepSY domain-containing protein [Nitrososphaera viennensis]|uniref:PepSY domain-containing protein n=1 Tax=Nitrososphaera viennensis TaxID=1034015 RepID=UPI00130E6DB4|nr:PepSY domain-containing protein [Nitrososphaera viennensis]
MALGFAVASPAIVAPAAFAQDLASPEGNQTSPGGNQTAPGGNSTQTVAFVNNNNNNGITTIQDNGNQTVPEPEGQQLGQPGQITGTIDVKQAIKDFLTENLNVTLSEAVATAETQANGTAVVGHLDVVQGFLVYSVIVVDINNEMLHSVIVDAGDGSVLASQAIPLAQLGAMHGGMMMGPHGGMFGGPGGQMMQPPPGNETSEGPMGGMGF